MRRPRPGSIAATVTLFLALGGGAIAFSGSGTLQKENEIGIPPGGAEVIRTIAGAGEIQAGDCVDGDGNVGFRNTSGELLSFRVDKGNTLDSTDALTNGSGVLTPFTADEVLQYHISPADGSKSPQADITVSVDHTGNCATTQVAVINLTTTG